MSAPSFQRLSVQLRFDTPAFLGDAEQSGAWRTPPFKALLRQWWRVLAAQACGYDVNALRERERELFGGVFGDGEDKGRRSAVRLRLAEWRPGTLASWPAGGATVPHPEVPKPVAAELYLGYGPLMYRAGSTALKKDRAIQAGEANTLDLLAPADVPLAELIRLVDGFGTVGGRSRNGWGSLALDAGHERKALMRDDALLTRVSRPLADCLKLDWPHAFGTDDKGLLVWQTAPQKDWRAAMVTLAKAKIAFRTRLSFERNTKANPVFEARHVLAYPVTNHSVKALGNQARLAGQLRFKVVRGAEGHVGRVFHLPCAFPTPLRDAVRRERAAALDHERTIWQVVHGVLDGLDGLTRL